MFDTLSNVLNRDLDPDPVGTDDLPLTHTECRMVDFALLLARRAILLKWKDAAPPVHRQNNVLSQAGDAEIFNCRISEEIL